MDFKHLESQSASHSAFMYDTIYFQSPDEYDDTEQEDWEDEEDESFDDEVENLDDLNSARMGNDLETSDDAYDITNPDPDDDHLPDDDLQ